MTRKVLVDTNIRWPNGLTLDHTNKRIFWMEAKHHEISSVDWNGNNRKLYFDSKSRLQQPYAVTFFRNSLYWSDWNTR